MTITDIGKHVMSYIKNFEPPSPRFLSTPFIILLVVIIASVSLSVGMPWWAWVVATVAGVFGGPYFVDREYAPVRTAKNEYLDYLSSCSLQELARVVNDPNRPTQTKALVRHHLDKVHPGWHEQLNFDGVIEENSRTLGNSNSSR